MPEPGGVEALYGRLAEHYHLIFGDELVAAFEAAGLRDVRWIGAEESGYHQPLHRGDPGMTELRAGDLLLRHKPAFRDGTTRAVRFELAASG